MKQATVTVAIVLACVAPLFAQVAALAPVGKPQYFDNNGQPLSGGSITTQAAGTSTPLPSYTDSTGGTANSNPVTLDVSGRASIWLTSGTAYKLILKNSAGVTIWTVDNVVGVGSSGGGGGGGGGNFWTLTGTSIYNNNSGGGGSVGVGTNGPPAAPLHVLGSSIGTNHVFRIDDLGNVPGLDLFASGSKRSSITAPTTLAMQVASSADAALLTLTQTGRLGIGTTTPTVPLDVNGDVNITGNIVISGTCTVAGVSCGGGGGGSGYSIVQDEGTALTQRNTINFIGAGVTCVDNMGAMKTNCTITGGSGGFPVSDNTSLFENNADNTKVGKFSLTGLTTGTTRTLTWQDANYTIAGTNVAQTFSSAQTFHANILTDTTSINIGSTGNPFQDQFFKQTYTENLRIATAASSFATTWLVMSDVANVLKIQDNSVNVLTMDCGATCFVHLLGTTNVRGTTVGTLYPLQIAATGAAAGINFFENSSTKVGSIVSGASAPLNVQDQNDVSRMLIFQNGNTQIGSTTDQGYKLYVNGSIFANGNVTCTGTCGGGGASPFTRSGTTVTLVNTGDLTQLSGDLRVGWARSNSSLIMDRATDGGNTALIDFSVAGNQFTTGTWGLGAYNARFNLFYGVGQLEYISTDEGGRSRLTGTTSGTTYPLGVRATSTGAGINFFENTSTKVGSISSGSTSAFSVSDQNDVFRLLVFQNGDVQIGSTTDQGYPFYVNGIIRSSNFISAAGGFIAGGSSGISGSIAVRNAANTGSCLIYVQGGIVYNSTC